MQLQVETDELGSELEQLAKAKVCLTYLGSHFFVSFFIFTARCHASAVLAMARCPSLRLSITSRSSTKTAKRRIAQTTQHDSPGTLVL